MRTPALVLLSVLAASGLSGSCVIELGDFGGVKASKDVQLAFTPSAPITEILVDTFNGSVTIEADEAGTVTGTSKVWARASSEERAQERMSSMNWTFSEEGKGVVTLKMAKPSSGGGSNAGASAVLKVPVGARVRVDTGNGEVEIHGPFPYAWVDTSNGSVVVVGAKDVVVDTSNGPVDVQADGQVSIDTSNGGVKYRGASRDFDIDTSNGDVQIDLLGDWSGKAVVDSSNGSITLNCTGTLRCALHHDTSNGKLHLEGPAVEGGSGKLSLETSNSSIWVKHGPQ